MYDAISKFSTFVFHFAHLSVLGLQVRSRPGPIHIFVGIDHEIISTAILLPSAEGLLSVTSESMCTKYWLTA